MSNKLAKKLKREKNKKEERKIQLEIERLKRQEEIKKEAALRLEEQKIVGSSKSYQEAMHQQMQMMAASSAQGNPADPKMVINYIADRNGCGYFRCIWPYELLATYKTIFPINSFIYHMEPGIISKVHTLRFQRQATDSQLQAWNNYLSIKKNYSFKFKMQYEIDDLLMEIDPANKIAFDFFDKKKKDNHMYMLNTADSITFSTENLKNIYINDYGVDANKIRVVRNHLPQFLYSFPYRHEPKVFNKTDKKPRVFWSGSASHLGPNNDLTFILPLVAKTLDEYQWVFQGVMPPELTEFAKAGKIEFIPWVPTYGLANMQFYKARPDICIAPLKPSRFNSCKSDLKYLECCALGAPVITTSFEDKGLKSPYDQAGAEICIEPDADVWKTMIDHLITNPDYYMNTVKNQYKFLNGRWLENNLDDWLKSIE